jgi:hypothetical protein
MRTPKQRAAYARLVPASEVYPIEPYVCPALEGQLLVHRTLGLLSRYRCSLWNARENAAYYEMEVLSDAYGVGIRRGSVWCWPARRLILWKESHEQ